MIGYICKVLITHNEEWVIDKLKRRGLWQDFCQEVRLAQLVYSTNKEILRHSVNYARMLAGKTQSKKRTWDSSYVRHLDDEQQQMLNHLEVEYQHLGKRGFTAKYCPASINPFTFASWASRSLHITESEAQRVRASRPRKKKAA